MSFQAYINNIKAKTGNGPEDFVRLAAKKGFTQNGKIKDGVKAGAIVQWLKEDFDLRHGARHGDRRSPQGHKSQTANNGNYLWRPTPYSHSIVPGGFEVMS